MPKKINLMQWEQFLLENRIDRNVWEQTKPEEFGFELELPKAKILLTYLQLWKNHWLSGKQLLDRLNTVFVDSPTTAPELRNLIKELRLQQHPIIANTNGYMLTNDTKQIEEYVASRWRELKREMVVLKEIDNSYYKIANMTIEDIINKEKEQK